MKYDKSNWQRKLGIKKVEGGFEIPLSNVIISNDSTIKEMKFEDRPDESIRIMGEYIIESEGNRLSCQELVEELVDYFNDQIRGKSILKIKFNTKMDLEIVINASPRIKILVNTESTQYPYEKWQYSHKLGYITN